MSLTAIVLTFNEQIHIERCITSILGTFPNAKVVVVDSGSTDDTVSLARSLDCDVFVNPFTSQAQQFQWALDNIPISTQWNMRLDADEYFPDVGGITLSEMLASQVSEDIHGILIPRYHVFLGQSIKHGGRYPLYLLRIWKTGAATVQNRLMDEHILVEGRTLKLQKPFADENLQGISYFISKHNSYATREAVQRMLEDHLSPRKTKTTRNLSAAHKLYRRLPLALGPFFYFSLRFVILGGFLDGPRGSAYHFLQGFWYRYLVELKLRELRAKSKGMDYHQKIQFLSKEVGHDISSYT
jgi:glycosyltransferase involved in cell wall biosynthesis